MKKARALSTICISLAAGPLAAQVPDAWQCFARGYDAAHLAANPRQGVEALRLWFYDADLADPASRAVIVEARMAHQGQALAAGVGGLTLSSTLYCEGDGCFVECDGGGFTVRPFGEGIELTTTGAVIGTAESCGGAADLAEGGLTRYRLAAVPEAACADLAHVHPLPEPGCYGVAYPRADDSGTLAALTLRLQAPELDGMRPAFPWLEGGMALDIAPAAATAGVFAGARVILPVWCGADSGQCASGPGEVVLDYLAAEGGLVLSPRRIVLYDEDDAAVDLTAGRPSRHALVALAPEACAGLVLE